eukprot:UN29405
MEEVNILQKLRNVQHVIKLIDHEKSSDGKLYLVLELGDIALNEIIKSGKGGRITCHATLRKYWRDILKCVGSVHDEHIVHGDLKPANFLSVSGDLKIIDFGISGVIDTANTANIHRQEPKGTLDYMAPESLQWKENATVPVRIGRASDIWALGCILHLM